MKIKPLQATKLIAPFVSIVLLLGVAQIALYIYCVIWLYNLKAKGCKCIEDWRKEFIMWYPLAAWTVGLLLGFMAQISARITSAAVSVGWLAFVVFVFQYVAKLRSQQCECALKGPGDELLQVLGVIPIVGWTLSILALLGVVALLKK